MRKNQLRFSFRRRYQVRRLIPSAIQGACASIVAGRSSSRGRPLRDVSGAACIAPNLPPSPWIAERGALGPSLAEAPDLAFGTSDDIPDRSKPSPRQTKPHSPPHILHRMALFWHYFGELYSSLPSPLFPLAHDLGFASLSRFCRLRFWLGAESQNLIRNGVQRLLVIRLHGRS